MQRKKRIKIALTLGAIGLTAVYALFFFLQEPPEQEVVILPVKTLNAEFGTCEQSLKLFGFVQNDNTVTVFPGVSGTILDIPVKISDTVEKDALLGRIDDTSYAFQLNQAKAAYDAVSASWTRVQDLYANNSVSQQVYDTIKAEFESARSQYNLAQFQYDYTEITAPVSGTILQIHTAQGNTAVPTQPFLTLGNTDSLKIQLAVPERYITLFESDFIREENTMFVQIPVLDNISLNATLQTVAPYISPATGTFEAECTLDYHEYVRSGMFARVFITSDRKADVYTLPYSVLTGGNTLWYVEEGKAHSLAYEDIFAGDDSFVINEEYASYNFIYDGQHFLNDGDAVAVLSN